MSNVSPPATWHMRFKQLGKPVAYWYFVWDFIGLLVIFQQIVRFHGDFVLEQRVCHVDQHHWRILEG